MRGLLGGIILVAGVGGLGWYATQGPAVAMQAQIADAAKDVARRAQHDVSAMVSGRDVTVTGVAEDADEIAALRSAFDGITGRRVVNLDGVTTLPVVSPYVVSIAKGEDGTTATGSMPSQAALDALGVTGLDIANGEPNDAWADAVATSLRAMETLKSGTLDIADTTVTVSGLAATPSALEDFNAQIGQLPEGYTATSDIDVEDDGTPLRLSLRYDGATLSGSGKIPADLAIDDLAIAGAETALDVQEARIPSADGLWPDVTRAAIAALAALSDGTLEIADQTVTLSGTGTPDGLDAAAAALESLPDGYDATTDLALFDDGVPFSLTVEKTEETVTVAGKLPADFESAMGAGLLDGATLDELSVAFITDPTATWPAIAESGFTALATLEEGTLTIMDESVTLTGTALTPDARDAALTALGDITNVTTDIALLDDGAPVTLTLTYDAEDGAALSGKLPSDVTVIDVSEAIGLEVDDAETTQAIFPSETDVLGQFQTLRSFLPEFANLTFTATQDEATLNGTAITGVAADRLAEAVQTALGAASSVAIDPQTDLPAAGTTRTNRFTGREEVFTSGYWLPTFDFFATPESCTEQTEAVLNEDQVQFVTGSADLDVTSIRAINALSALARKCALEGGVFLQVAGHTDNTGDPAANLALSQDRADAVRDALLERGLARSVVTAIGYGDTQPIADNETEEGRAANRRTAFTWNFE